MSLNTENVQDALGNLVTTLYDAAGQVVASQDQLGYRTSYQYDLAGRRIETQNARGCRSTAVYDAEGEGVAQIDALGNRWSSVYDALGRSVASVDTLGNRTTTLYDARGMVQANVDPLGNRVSQYYDGAGQRLASEDPLGRRSSAVYDALGRVQAGISARGCRTTSVYDSASQQIASQDALGFIHSMSYGPSGRLDASIDPLGFVTSQHYDALGRLLDTEDALGNRVSTLYDIADRVIAQQDARGYRTSFTLDALGRRTALTDANGGAWSTTYDARGLESGSMDPLGARHTWMHDPVGNRSLRIDARGWPTSYAYDALDRELTRQYPNGERVTWAYDAAGRRILMGDVTGNTVYAFDALGREVAVANPTGHRLSYGFDAAGNRAWMDAANGRTSYAYDAENRCALIWNPYNERTSMAYDALGRELRKTLGNGMTVSHLYDAAGRETLLENRKPTGEGIGIYSATYDAVGNRLTSQELDGSRVSYGYDRSYQLTSEQRSGTWPYDIAYQYDGVGNRLVKVSSGQRTTSSYNIAQELTRIEHPSGPPTSMTWDANGNLETETTGAAIVSYTWDAENQSRKILQAPGTAPVQSDFLYRADKHRGKQTLDGDVRHLVWDEVNCLFELDSGLLVVADYSGLPGQWGGLASMRRGGTSSFYGFDQQWTTRQLLSAMLATSDEYWQDAFGVELGTNGATVNPYRYEGAYGYRRENAVRDDVWYRMLRRDLGSWSSRDSLYIATTSSLYNHIHNRPLFGSDPSGLKIQLNPNYQCPPTNKEKVQDSGVAKKCPTKNLCTSGWTQVIDFKWVCPPLDCNQLGDSRVQSQLIRLCKRDIASVGKGAPLEIVCEGESCCWLCPPWNSGTPYSDSWTAGLCYGARLCCNEKLWDSYPNVYQIALCEHEKRRGRRCREVGDVGFGGLSQENQEHRNVQGRIYELLKKCPRVPAAVLAACKYPT